MSSEINQNLASNSDNEQSITLKVFVVFPVLVLLTTVICETV